MQTFVLAQQPSGYFVLNDILRYIEEGEDDAAETTNEDIVAAESEPVADVTAEPEAVQASEPALPDPVVIDQKLEEVSTKDSEPVNGSTEAPVEDSAPTETKAEAPAEDADLAEQELAEADAKDPEKPQDPSPTPVTKPTQPPPATVATPAPAEPAAPPKPMTWASRAAAAAGPKPVVPLPKTATPPAPAQSRAPAPASVPSQTTANAPAAAPVVEPSTKEAGWQTAGADSKRQNRPQSISGAPTEKEGTMGYVKYVTEKVQDADLRGALAAHGELTYFDINRQKVCDPSDVRSKGKLLISNIELRLC